MAERGPSPAARSVARRVMYAGLALGLVTAGCTRSALTLPVPADGLPRPVEGARAGDPPAGGAGAGHVADAERLAPGSTAGGPPARAARLVDAGPAGRRWVSFRREFLDLVNRARRAAGLAPVALDGEAWAFAQGEALRLVSDRTFGHYGADGSKPYQRWARIGGVAHVRENLFRLTVEGARAYMVFDPAEAHASLMSSPGHRENILDPAHTGLGVGVAYDRERNTVYVVQEFVSRYLALEPAASAWHPGETREVHGRLLDERGVEPRMAVLYREATPGSAQARRQARRRSYREGSEERSLVLRGDAFALDPRSGEFRLRVDLPRNLAAGTYTLTLYVGPPMSRQGGAARRAGQAVPPAPLVPAADLDVRVLR